MTSSLPVAASAAALLLAILPGSARGAESYDNCKGFITSVPTTITSQGVWCMNADVAANLATGYAIDVQVNNVTVDCNGFKLGNLGAGNTTAAIGVRAEGRLNTTVRGCNVRGFYTGVYLNGSGHVVEDTRVESSASIGVWVAGQGGVVRRNVILDTGTGFHAAWAGVSITGTADVMDNVVTGVVAKPESDAGIFGIYIDSAAGGRVERNAVRDLAPDGTGSAYGIFINNTGGGVSLSGNRLYSGGSAMTGAGIQCAGVVTSYLVDNHMIGFENGFGGCVDVATNHSAPTP